jgi:predicted transcriptional regulator
LQNTVVSQPSAVYVKNTAVIVASYVAQHQVATSSLPDVIRNVFDTLRSLDSDASNSEVELASAAPDSALAGSIFPEYLVCLEDGEQHKMLKRHLWTRYRLTPEAYRKKWGLSDDYPMIAPNYAKLRSNIAKHTGLGGRKRR